MDQKSSKIRLDDWLVDQGYYPSRARARDAIKRGCITLGSNILAKPSRTVTEPDLVQVNDPARKWVSRAALKLLSGLERTGFDPSGKLALDIGASTGGFTQVLIEHGAKHVFAVDVGHDQMDARLAGNPHVTNIEGLNARDLSAENLDNQPPQFVVSDVSFISLKLALPAALELASINAKGIFLVKPQFEVGKEHIGRGGIVRDYEQAHSVAENLADWLNSQSGWTTHSLFPSPISGGDGNAEYLLCGVKNGAD